MKKLIVGIVLGVAIASATTATAATSYWRHLNKDVECSVTAKSVSCMTTHGYVGDRSYSVFISDCSVAVWQDRGGEELAEVYTRWQPKCR